VINEGLELKRKEFWLMLFIVTLGSLLRLAYIDKPDGLWNDEYVSWMIASLPIGKSFFDAIVNQCHMPFYYFYLKFFIHYYGNSDFMLRLTSVLPGILSIISMYFVGKELKNKNLGILCASVTALSSFLIYFSQEVRFYSLLFFFSSLALFFTLRLCKEPNRKDFVLYVISNFLIIFTHTLGFIFVFFNVLFLILLLMKDNKKVKMAMIITGSSLLVLTLISSPLLIKILATPSFSQWWGHFTVSKIAFVFTDYFTPMLVNLVNAPDSFFYNVTPMFIIFTLIPATIAIVGIVNALIVKNYKVSGLFYSSIAFFLTLVIAAMLGKLVLLTKYSVEIYPTLILVMGFGLLEFKKGWRYFLIFAFCFLNLFYIFLSPLSAPKIPRNQGHKVVANLLKKADLKSGDVILLNYYNKDRFEKYFDFRGYEVYSINKNNFYKYLNISLSNAVGMKDEAYKAVFSAATDKYFNNMLEKNVLSNLKPNHKIAVVVLNDVAMYSPTVVSVLARKGEKEYKKVPFPFLAFSQIKNDTLKECFSTLQPLKFQSRGSWAVVTFKKK